MRSFPDTYLANLNVICYDGGSFAAKNGTEWSSYGTISFAQSKLYYILTGSCEIVIGGEKYEGAEGDWFLIPKNTQHSFRSHREKPFKKLWMHFDLFPDTDIFRVLNLPYHVKANKNRTAEIAFLHFIKFQKSCLLSDRLMAKAEFFKLFADYIRAAYPDGIKVQSDSQLQLDSLLQYIHTHIAAPLPNRKLSAFVHMHPNHFIRFFKMQTGFTPASYIRKERMDLAKRLLEESELTISEVGEKAGFDDLAHFSKNFKQYFSMTPSAYRDFFKRNPVTYSTTLFS